MAAERMVKLIKYLIIISILLSPLCVFSEESQNINGDMIKSDFSQRLEKCESSIQNFDKNLDRLYTKSISTLNYFLTVVMAVLTLLGLWGVLNIRSTKNKYDLELKDLQSFKKEYKDQILELDPQVTKLKNSYIEIVNFIRENLYNSIFAIKLSEDGSIINSEDVDMNSIRNGFAFIDDEDKLPERVLFMKAKSFHDSLEFEEAKNLYLLLKKKFPYEPLYPYSLGVLYIDTDEKEMAMLEFTFALKINSNFYPAHINKANLFIQENKDKEAIEEFSIAVKLFPDRIEGWNGILAVMLENKNIEAAEKALETAEEIDSSFPSVRYNKACLRVLQERKSEAIQILSELFETHPDRKRIALVDEQLQPIWGKLNSI